MWAFDPSSAEVALLDFVLADGREVATAIRSLSHPLKPVKIFHHNRLVAALVGNLLLTPSGNPLGLIGRMHTPGVRHMWFCRNAATDVRVLCKATRAWVPPSRTWLFPPRCETHDVGGWCFEWEGPSQGVIREGGLPPEAFVLLVGLETLAREQQEARAGRKIQGEHPRPHDIMNRLRAACRSLSQRLLGVDQIP